MSAEINIYRHGKSKKNDEARANIVAGRSTKAPLVDIGERQATDLGLYLAKKDIVAAYASPADRAYNTGKTALHAARLDHLVLNTRSGLEEISQGVWEGNDRTSPLLLPDGTIEYYTHPRERGLDGRVYGGESIREVGARMQCVLTEIGAEHEGGGEIAVFGHDFAIRCLVVALTGDDIEKLNNRIAYCSETRVRCEDSELILEYAGKPVISRE